MDYFIGFLLGYYCRIFFNYLKKLNDKTGTFLPSDNYIREDWDWLSTDDPK